MWCRARVAITVGDRQPGAGRRRDGVSGDRCGSLIAEVDELRQLTTGGSWMRRTRRPPRIRHASGREASGHGRADECQPTRLADRCPAEHRDAVQQVYFSAEGQAGRGRLVRREDCLRQLPRREHAYDSPPPRSRRSASHQPQQLIRESKQCHPISGAQAREDHDRRRATPVASSAPTPAVAAAANRGCWDSHNWGL